SSTSTQTDSAGMAGGMDGADSGALTSGMGDGGNLSGSGLPGAVANLQTVFYFDFDQSNIRSEFVEMLDAHAAFLVANPNQMVVLEGHADERGTREYNLGLGERRAKQVATFLQIKGVSAAQIDTVSYGEEKPLAIGKTEAEYSQNRRVEIVYK
ncbi:MAG: peptidoglycan-associated lipoprotein Pal, partial [Reinekea sp.]|nr:peptidoglycan-associated lipoprotein Pal [Reinekea sp.]